VSVVADKYDVPDLQLLAAQRYLRVLERWHTRIDPFPTMTRLLASVSSADSPVFKSLLPFWLRHSSDLGIKYGAPKLKSLLFESKYFAMHIATALAEVKVYHDCPVNRLAFSSHGNAMKHITSGCACGEWGDDSRPVKTNTVFAGK
jgi:hypothetical protein